MELQEAEERIQSLELRLEQIQNQADALQLALSWVLAMQPRDEVLRFLTAQANELETKVKFEDWVHTLDDLTEDVRRWHAQWDSTQAI